MSYHMPLAPVLRLLIHEVVPLRADLKYKYLGLLALGFQ